MKTIKRIEVFFKLNRLIGLRVEKQKEGNSLNIDIHGMDDYFYYRSNRH